MLLSDKTIDLLDEGKLTELIDGAEFPRDKFLRAAARSSSASASSGRCSPALRRAPRRASPQARRTQP